VTCGNIGASDAGTGRTAIFAPQLVQKHRPCVRAFWAAFGASGRSQLAHVGDARRAMTHASSSSKRSSASSCQDRRIVDGRVEERAPAFRREALDLPTFRAPRAIVERADLDRRLGRTHSARASGSQP
jgi:hypothetical protein